MQNVYFISGLGADQRAFQFLDLSFCNPVFVKWLKPEKGETMSNYAVRMKQQIPDEEPVIVGLSFGGMIAVEIARQFPVKKIILLSSAKGANEIPYYLKYLRYFPLHRVASAAFLRSANQLAYRLMGIENRKDKIVLKEMFKDSDDAFIKWAIHQVVHWKNSSIFHNTVHIHGTADILLPHRFVRADHVIKGGEHLMLILQAEAISALLQEIIVQSSA